MNKLTKIATEDVNGVTYIIQVDGGGTFYAEVDGVLLQAATKSHLVDKLEVVKKPKRVSVPATYLYSGKLIPITMTGIHAANGNIVYRVDGESGSKQLSRYNYRTDVYRAMSADERGEYDALMAASEAADQAIKDWLEPRSLNPRNAIEKALSADAVATPVQDSHAGPIA